MMANVEMLRRLTRHGDEDCTHMVNGMVLYHAISCHASKAIKSKK